MKIVDRDGKWFINNAQFRMVDGDSGTFFEPGEATKATETAWLGKQPHIVEVEDPNAPEGEVVPKRTRGQK